MTSSIRKLLAMGIILTLIAFAGCSSNPASSTLTCDNGGSSIDYPYADNTAGPTCDSAGAPCGHEAIPTSGPPEKYDEDIDNDTMDLPVYPN